MDMKNIVLIALCSLLASFVLVDVRAQGTSATVAYIRPMIIGRTFDLSKSLVGGDIFESNTIQLATVADQLTQSRFQMVRTTEQVRDVLDISGQLSLQLMSGMVNVKGEGKYLEESTKSSSFVEVLAKITFRTETHTIKNQPKLRDGWNVKPIGQHYVRGITYGGYLIASLKFHAKSESDKKNIEAKISGDVKTASTTVEVEGQFQKLASAVKDISTLTISYTATAPLTTVPTDIPSLVQAIKNFPDMVKKATSTGRGVPITAHLLPLSELDKGNKELQFLRDLSTTSALKDMNDKFFDLLEARSAVKAFLQKYPYITDEAEKQLGTFYGRTDRVVNAFTRVIANLDLRSDNAQFKTATDAYNEGNSITLPGKFKRDFDGIIANKRKMVLNPPDPVAYRKNGVLFLGANNSYTAVAQENKVNSALVRIESELSNIKSQSLQSKNRYLAINIKSDGTGSIIVNGVQHSPRRPGYNVVVVNAENGAVTHVKSFDTHQLRGGHSNNLKSFLDGIPSRRIVLVATQGGAYYTADDVIKSLERLGAYNVERHSWIFYFWRYSSYALVGWSGPGVLGAVEQVQRAGESSIIAKLISLPVIS